MHSCRVRGTGREACTRCTTLAALLAIEHRATSFWRSLPWAYAALGKGPLFFGRSVRERGGQVVKVVEKRNNNGGGGGVTGLKIRNNDYPGLHLYHRSIVTMYVYLLLP